MTAINVVSSLIYTKDAPFREKIQIFALAGIFLVLLYNSPSGLVFYWVLNQIFSLCKNIVRKMAHPGKIVYAFLCAMLCVVSGYLILFKDNKFSTAKCFLYFFTLFFILAPFIWNFLKSKKIFIRMNIFSFATSDKQNFVLLFLSCFSLCLLCGLLLPSSVIATSPAEFSFLGNTDSPLSYICSSLMFFVGLFVFWPLVVYKMFGDNKMVKAIMPPLFFVLAMCALANAFLFKYHYGTISVDFKLDNANVLRNSLFFYSLIPLLLLIVLIFIQRVIDKFFLRKWVCFFILGICFAQCFVFLGNAIKIKKVYISLLNNKEYKSAISDKFDSGNVYNLSRTQPNVFILFLDRAISCFFPYILEQFPELKNSFDGFIYYPNTLSFADFTNSAAPAMCGGYDYSVDEINKRNKELLKDKHNEALKVLPLIFENAGYNSSVYGLPCEDYDSGRNIWITTGVNNIEFPNTFLKEFYQQNPDMFNENLDISVKVGVQKFSFLQILYPLLRRWFYGGGSYYQAKNSFFSNSVSESFMKEYIQLVNYPAVTSFSSSKPTFHYISNYITHEYVALLEDYIPGCIDETHPVAGTGFYKTLQEDDGSSENDFLAYHVNASAILQVGKWLDYLKENNVYDNTRVIIVADHGRGVKLPCFKDFEDWYDIGFLNPLLLVKDFNSHGEYKTNMELHTNADVPYFATKDLNVSKVNPFTGNQFKKSSDFDSFNVYRIDEWQVEKYSGKKQFPLKGKKGYAVHDNIFDESNWEKLDTSGAAK